ELVHGNTVLRFAAIMLIVKAQDFLDFIQGETDVLAAHDQCETGAVTRIVDTGLAAALRRQEALVLVKADGAGGEAELIGEFGYRKCGTGACNVAAIAPKRVTGGGMNLLFHVLSP